MRLPLLTALLLLPTAAAAQSAGSTVTVDVATFRNQKGVLGCRLYDRASGFPESSKGAAQQSVAIAGGSSTCVFPNVAPGTYAIGVIHDENVNHVLDKNFLGIPTEGYGVSNNHTHATSAPSWDESKFTVEAGVDKRLSITLRY